MAIPKKLELDASQLTVGNSLIIFKATKQDAQLARLKLMRVVLEGKGIEDVDGMLLDEAGQHIIMYEWMKATKKRLPDEYIAGEALSAILTGLFGMKQMEVDAITLAELPEVQEMIRVAVEGSRDKAVPPTSAAGSESGPAE